MITILKLEEDASWDEIYEALRKTEIPELKACLKAAEWWLQKVKETRPTGPTFPKQIAHMFEGLPFGDSGTTTSEEDIIFISSLVYRKAHDLIHFSVLYSRVFLRTDHHPDRDLRETGELVGIGEFSFPFKSGTMITRDSVQAWCYDQEETVYEGEVDEDYVTPDIFATALDLYKEIYYQGKYDDVKPVQVEQSKILKKTPTKPTEE